MAIQSVNPATEEVLSTYDEMSDAEVDRALAQVQAAFEDWRSVPITKRAAKLRNAGAYLRKHCNELATLVTLEMGKPITQAEFEVNKCALGCDYYADNADEFLTDEHIATEAAESFVAYSPLGVILAVMPWNFPYWQTFRPLMPGFVAGNGMVLKHASNVPQCALAIERVMLEAGFPEGLFRTLLVSSSRMERIIEDPRVRLVTLTGSCEAGREIASVAGRALKKTVMELGGSDPFIVLADANLEQAATVGAMARNQNTGQSCIAAKRFLIVESVADEFERRFVDAVSALKVGDPMDRTTQIGPLAREDLVEILERQVKESVSQGAKLALGGQRLDRKGYFYAPTILTGVTPRMTVAQEETFGPAAAVIRVKDDEEAIRLANASAFGLGASLWSSDIERAKKLARRIEAGNVYINTMVASNPRLPFGGVKDSGWGRELSSFGMRELVNVQTIGVGPLG